jgi:hypothetical protein
MEMLALCTFSDIRMLYTDFYVRCTYIELQLILFYDARSSSQIVIRYSTDTSLGIQFGSSTE